MSLACINTYLKRWKDIKTTFGWKCISGNISIRFSPSLRLLRQPSKSPRLSWMTKSFPYVRLSHVGADRWRPGAQLVHDSGKPSTGYTVHAASSLRKLYSFIIIRDVATAVRPAVTPPSRGPERCRITAHGSHRNGEGFACSSRCLCLTWSWVPRISHFPLVLILRGRKGAGDFRSRLGVKRRTSVQVTRLRPGPTKKRDKSRTNGSLT